MKIKLSLILIVTIFLSSTSFGQKTDKKIVISGVVRDTLQNPIKGARIFVDNKETPYVTNRKGYYKIKVKSEAKKILVFSPQIGVNETLIDGRTSIDFRLTGSSKFQVDNMIKNNKDEIVDAGYGVRNKKEMTSGGALASNPKLSTYSDIYELIRMELPTVFISGKSIYLQGNSSYAGNSSALFVVDDIIMDSIDSVSPYDVKSVQALTGPATAVYGMRGANGVIIIKTLRGTDKR